MAKKVSNIPVDRNIIRIPLEEAMPDNYLPYAIEVAKDRALPDVRDGLKPVHRRILYGAYLLKAFPDRPYYKSARIVGDILGKFHPHGDSSVYDAMVILAQNFSTRELLIDGHGNWGSMDGDGAAAMRYTEARLAPIAMEMIRDIDKDTVDMVPNYSDSEMEPTVLPSRYPNLLVNGAFGIAVGLATNIPPHNLGEVTKGVLAYIDNPEITTEELMKHIKGPDLPTGGVLIGKNSLKSAYETGEGKVTCRAKTNIETLENGRLGIVITEFPYKRNKSKLLQTISEMTADKKHAKVLEGITDIRDESDRNGIRAVIEFKKSFNQNDVAKVLKYLFKKTDLQCNISFNMVALADGKPQTMGLKTIIYHYVNHQKDVITRRTKRELEIAEKRFHIVEGFIKAIDIMDDVIETIRASKSKKDASENLISKFEFTEVQAGAILELMLYRLTGLEIKVFKKEYNELKKLIKKFNKILSEEKELLKVVKSELEEVTEKFESPRKTDIIEDDSEAKIDVEELIVIEDVMVTLSNDGFIKRIPTKNYIRSNQDVNAIEYREGDELKFLFESNTTENILLFTDKGNMYQMKGINIPEGKWKDKGEKIDTLIKINLEEEKIINVMSEQILSPNKYVQFITNKGIIKKSSLDKFKTSYTKLQAIKLKENEEVISIVLLNGEENKEFLKVKTKLGLEFNLELPQIEDTPRNILGTSLFNISSKDTVIYCEYKDSLEYKEFAIGVTNKNTLKAFSRISKNDNLKAYTDNLSDILLFTDKGNLVKIKSFILESVLDKEIKISDVVDGIMKDEKIIKIISLKNYKEDLALYSTTKKGLIKKTILSEFSNEFTLTQYYKLKYEDDRVVSIEINSLSYGEIVMITKKGMAIRFLSSNLNTMGKIASGVTGISLKENDEVIYAKNILNSSDDELAITSEKDNKFILTSLNKVIKEVEVSDIKLQNRAGRGTDIMMIALDDEIESVQYN
ncbi:DNA topoisomerase IV subunit A [Clostridium sp.]|uniref:DNA topoisomerase IV subunit A n=1 Tax=Clostridium sp. TaxID=1506 RepID=UPI002A91055F|nr:DNA topoisomerase IV subunit A [Clostridium sp.]MDY6012333.1 DNA topoisomerase IV subunit A [Clostridium sp.]